MKKVILLIFFLLNHVSGKSVILCDLSETVNLTGGYKDIDNNYIFGEDVYQVGMYGNFNYISELPETMTIVESHTRGCVCHLKPCIRLCCVDNTEIMNGHCVNSPQLLIKNDDEETEIDIKTSKKYGILIGKMCTDAILLTPDNDSDDFWKFHDVKLFSTHKLH